MNLVNPLGTVGIWVNNIPVIEDYTRRLLRWWRVRGEENQGDNRGNISGRIDELSQRMAQLVIVVQGQQTKIEDISDRLAILERTRQTELVARQVQEGNGTGASDPPQRQ